MAGADFTPGGRVYLAVYDRTGATPFETRWITADNAVTTMNHQPGHGLRGGYRVATPGGGLREAFASLCGATAMVRALDEETAVWSNWLPVSFACQ